MKFEEKYNELIFEKEDSEMTEVKKLANDLYTKLQDIEYKTESGETRKAAVESKKNVANIMKILRKLK